MVVTIVLTGCASGQEARNAARVLLAQTITYEEQVDQKIKVETHYTKESLKNFKERLTAQKRDTETNIVNRVAQDASALVVNEKTALTFAVLRDLIDRAVASVDAARAEYGKTVIDLGETLRSSLTALDLKRDGLEKVRKGLEKLQEEPDDKERLKAWLEFARKTKEEYDKSKSAGK